MIIGFGMSIIYALISKLQKLTMTIVTKNNSFFFFFETRIIVLMNPMNYKIISYKNFKNAPRIMLVIG